MFCYYFESGRTNFLMRGFSYLQFLSSVLMLDKERFEIDWLLSDLDASPTVAGFFIGSEKDTKSSVTSGIKIQFVLKQRNSYGLSSVARGRKEDKKWQTSLWKRAFPGVEKGVDPLFSFARLALAPLSYHPGYATV